MTSQKVSDLNNKLSVKIAANYIELKEKREKMSAPAKLANRLWTGTGDKGFERAEEFLHKLNNLDKNSSVKDLLELIDQYRDAYPNTKFSDLLRETVLDIYYPIKQEKNKILDGFAESIAEENRELTVRSPDRVDPKSFYCKNEAKEQLYNGILKLNNLPPRQPVPTQFDKIICHADRVITQLLDNELPSFETVKQSVIDFVSKGIKSLFLAKNVETPNVETSNVGFNQNYTSFNVK